MIQILKSVPFFSELPQADLEAIAGKVTMEYFPKGYLLFREGDPGSKMYIIKTGSVEVIRGNATVATLKAGEFFGEMALVSDQPRTATIQVTSDAELLVLQKEDFQHLLGSSPSIASKVSYEVVHRVNEND